MNSSTQDDWNQHWEDYSNATEENPAQAYRRTLIFSLLGLHSSGAGVRLLDIGSGQGDMAAAVRMKFPSAEILGLELSQCGVEIARRKVPSAQFVQRNLLKPATIPAEQRNRATHAVCSEVIEHVEDPVQLLRNAQEYMRPDCLLVLTAPGGPMSEFDKDIGHRKHYRADEIEKLFRKAGFVPEYVGRAGFPFFNLYRWVVILRGKKLIGDVSAHRNAPLSPLAQMVMSAFQFLFRMNQSASRWSWQMIVKAWLQSTKFSLTSA